MDFADLATAIRAHPPRVAVVGDAMLDRWVEGSVHRVSRESPVPVVDVDNPSEDCAGGAANTAVNLAALGAQVRIICAVGDDDDGAVLCGLLDAAGVDTSGVVAGGIRTACKTRILGNGQMIVRVDTGDARGSVEPPMVGRLVRRQLEALEPDETLVVCDYGAGLFDDRMIAAVAEHREGRMLVVDAHDLHRWTALHPDVVVPNAGEAAGVLGRGAPHSAKERADLAADADRVRRLAGAAVAVMTLDVDGTVAVDADGSRWSTSCTPRPDVQAIGAGDTFVAALTVALCEGAGLEGATMFAQGAADVVSAQATTGVCTLEDLNPPGVPRARGIERASAAATRTSARAV